LIDQADQIIAAGENLAARIRRRGREPTIITHGVDLDHWQDAADDASGLEKLRSLPRPRAIFWGLIDRRLDTSWLRALSTTMRCGSIVLIGPRQEPDPALASIPRLHVTGPLCFEQLPHAAALADVLIMPYADLPVTRAMQPLKLKEYLATGKPVVVRALPATGPWADCLDAADTPEAFAAAVAERLRIGLPEEQRAARGRLDVEGWAAKAEQFE